MIKKLAYRTQARFQKITFLNMVRYLKRFKKKLGFFQRFYYDFRLFPYSIAVENTTSCNRRCPYCPQRHVPRPAHQMPESLYQKMIDDLGRLKYRGKIIFAPWSETLLDERLPSFVRYAKARLPKSQIVVQTNGDLLTREKFEELREAGVGHIDVSDHYRREGDRYVIEEPRQAIRTYRQVDDAAKKMIHFHDLNYKRIRKIEPFHNRSGLVPLQDLISHERLYKKCSLPEGTMTINHAGEVLLCCRQWVDLPSFGNIKNDDIKKIWNAAEFRKIRKNLREGIFELELCRECGYGYLPDPR